jgi:hypothetical protein
MAIATTNEHSDTVRALCDTMFDHGHKNVELEFRMGRMVNGAFVAGVSKGAFDALLDILQRSPAFVRTDVTTLEKLNGTDARFVITNGDEANGRWCYKKKVHAHTDATRRISIALEGHDHAPPPPGSPPFTYHRLKKRTSFRHEWWSVDMTRVTSNLPGHFDNDEEIYEVELELTGVDAYFVYTLDHLVSWGNHLVSEIEALLTRPKCM